MPETQEVAARKGREGGRWLNERPSSEEFAKWFAESMRLDAALKHEDYVGGVVLIPAVDERAKHVTGFNQSTGEPIIAQRSELSYIPYAKVETRIAYFWDLLEVHPEWVATVEHVTSPRIPVDFITEEEVREGETGPVTIRRRQPGAMTVLVHQLPDGFSLMSVPVGQGYSQFLCCTTRVSIYRREDYEKNGERALPLRTGRGTKQVPLLMGRNPPYADANSLMKAETGAHGRALGFAGIFVIPGSGVATAEDMMEAMAQDRTPSEAPAEGNAGPATPDAPVRTGHEQQIEVEAQLKAKAAALWKALQEESPGRAQEFANWMNDRKHRDFNVSGPALRGIVRKLEKLRDESEQAVQQAPTDVPTEAPKPAEAPSGESSGQAG